MFDNIGGKIKTLAKVICVMGIIFSLVLGGMMLNAEVEMGLITMFAGAVGSWVSSLCLYGFGQMIEDTSAIRELLKGNGMPQNTPAERPQKPVVAAPVDKSHTVAWKCPKCSGFNGSEAEKCQFCGKSKA